MLRLLEATMATADQGRFGPTDSFSPGNSRITDLITTYRNWVEKFDYQDGGRR